MRRHVVVLSVAAIVLGGTGGQAQAPAQGSPSVAADSCGVPAAPPAPGTGPAPVIFPEGQYPVTLPAVSLLGARNDLPRPYLRGVHWGSLPEGRRWSSTASVTAAPDGTIWALDRCGTGGANATACASSPLDPILQFDSAGRLLKSFGRGLVVSPHKLTIDRAGDIWVADIGVAPGKGAQVHKFSPNGTEILTLGKAGEPGTRPDQFEAPTEVAVAPNGDIFVADGHAGGGAGGASRIVKFDKGGRFIKTIGKRGMGPAEFDLPHTLAFDSRGRLFVGDRQNNRIQILDQEGRFIAQWFQFGRPSGIYIDRTDTIYVADSESRDGRTNTGYPALSPSGYGFNAGARRGIRVGSARDGSVKAFIPDPCSYPYANASTLAEGVTADAAGNVYGADVLGTIRKFVKQGR